VDKSQPSSTPGDLAIAEVARTVPGAHLSLTRLVGRTASLDATKNHQRYVGDFWRQGERMHDGDRIIN
jgi:hypothetical protein